MLKGLRVRKILKLLPGVKLNLSKSGASVSIGKPGATVNLSSRGTKATVGLPGSGVSYQKNLGGGKGFYVFLLACLGFYVVYLLLKQ